MELTQPFDSTAEAGAVPGEAEAGATAAGQTGVKKEISGGTKDSEAAASGSAGAGVAGRTPAGWQEKRIGWFTLREILWISPVAAALLWGLALLAMTQVRVIFPRAVGFSWWVHDGLLLVILGLPLLALLGMAITAFNLAAKLRRLWLKIICALTGVALLVVLPLAGLVAFVVFVFGAKAPEATDICPSGHVCEYTNPLDPNDGFVQVYRESLLLRYSADQLDPFGNRQPHPYYHPQPTETTHELKIEEYPAACSIENTNYAVVVIDKAGPANLNILARAQNGIWEKVADLPNSGYCVACRFDADSRTLILTFQDTNGVHTTHTIPYPE